MRKLERNAQPDCLDAGAPGWTEDYLTETRRNPGHRFHWRSDICYRKIRQRLSEMTEARCAFCDGPIGLESRETVEHFRPKSQFPQFAYAWDNLFPCCDQCQSSKREGFDPALLKPDSPEYAFANYFVANYKSGALDPSPHADDVARNRTEVTIRMYGLNLPARKIARKREWERFHRDLEACIADYNYRFFLE